MTKHVEIWTLSKESRVVPMDQYLIPIWELNNPVGFITADKFHDAVNRIDMEIIKVSKCSAIHGRMERDSQIVRSDKYIAIHPDVEEAISVKWQEKIDEVIRTHKEESFELTINLINKEHRLSTFKRSPWYKRVWKAICNDI